MAPHTDARPRIRVARGAAIGVLAVAGLLVVGPANGSPTQPAPGTHTPTKADPPATHQPAPGTHVTTLSPGAHIRTPQPGS